MPSGIYTHKPNQGFKKGHKLNLGNFKNGVPYKETNRGIENIKISKDNYRVRHRKMIIEKLGNVCVRCGYSDERALQVDHINGGGRYERIVKKINTNKALYDDICNTVDKYQLLCANCNVIKRIENKEF